MTDKVHLLLRETAFQTAMISQVLTTPKTVSLRHENDTLSLMDHQVIATDIDNQVTLLYDIEAGLVSELLPGGVDARYVETGYLVYADLSDGLWAVEFDVDSGELTGEGTPVLSGLTSFLGRSARYSVSQTGTLAYSTGGGTEGALLPKQRLVLVGLDGVASEIPIAPRIYRNVRWSPDGSSPLRSNCACKMNLAMMFVVR